MDLCKPKEDRYKIAITRVCKKYLNAIVVNSQATATKCINHLRMKQMGRATFLPVADLRPFKLNTLLRGTDGVKLVLDVLHFDVKIIKVILFVVNNAIICETDEAAIFYSSENDVKFNVTNKIVKDCCIIVLLICRRSLWRALFTKSPD